MFHDVLLSEYTLKSYNVPLGHVVSLCHKGVLICVFKEFVPRYHPVPCHPVPCHVHATIFCRK